MEFGYILMVSLIFLDIYGQIQDANDWKFKISPMYLPATCYSMAIGYKSNKIWILGGLHYHSQQLVSYDTDSNNFTAFGDPILPNDVYGYGQYYTQINDMLYMVNPSGSWLDQFNMNNQKFSKFSGPEIPVNVDNTACLTSYKNYLIVLEGYTVQVMNVGLTTWLSDVPSMQVYRQAFSCIAHNNYLYAIGGSTNGGTDKFDSIEKLNLNDIDNIEHEHWIFIDNLNAKMDATRAIIFENNIMVIPGQGCGLYCIDINIIDTNTGIVTVNGKLNYSVGWTAAIIVNEILYAFGGYNQQFNAVWQYAIVPSNKTSENDINIWFFIAPLIGFTFCIGILYLCCCQKKKMRIHGYQMQKIKLSYGGIDRDGVLQQPEGRVGHQENQEYAYGRNVIDTGN
eukprot:506027_1